MSSVNVSWNEINPLNGSKRSGFEELCCQLANAKRPSNSEFIRKGTPDAGVECYAVLEDNSEWGWQAKYFDKLGDSQWDQIDHSVQTALAKHPRLVRYYICIPLDLSDARVEGRRSAKDRWDYHVEKWTRMASELNMVVEFIYWGAYELLNHLSKPEQRGRLQFWFGTPFFDKAWFKARLSESIIAAGPRYTPGIHVDLPIVKQFEAFGRTSNFFDELKALARPLRNKINNYINESSKDSLLTGELTEQSTTFITMVERILTELCEITYDPTGSLHLLQIAEKTVAAIEKADELERLIQKYEDEYKTQKKAANSEKPRATSSKNPFNSLQYYFRIVRGELYIINKVLKHANSYATRRLLLLTGDAGIGKTHLLCDVASKRLDDGRPTILLLGQRFSSSEDPWLQARAQLDLGDLSIEEFVGALETTAEITGCRALLIIDALNEGKGREIWPDHLAPFLEHCKRSLWIAVVLSVRTPYEEIVIPENVRKRCVKVKHQGFADLEYNATQVFFQHYGLELPSTPLLVPEFQNPLFLKLLCEGLKGKGEHRLSRGFQGITAIFEVFLNDVNTRLAYKLGFHKGHGLVQEALMRLAHAFTEHGDDWLPLARAQEIVDALLPDREYERSLYCGLVSEGLLIEDVIVCLGNAHDYIVRVAYNLFNDHLIAKDLLDRHLDLKSPEMAFKKDAPFGFLGDKERHVEPGLLEAFCVQIPELANRELTEFAPGVKDRWGFPEAFRRSLIWRAPKAFSKATLTTLNELIQTDYDMQETLDVLITLATLTNHPYNAFYLHDWLRSFSMPVRDSWWSTFLHRTCGSRGAVDRLVDWAWSITPSDQLDDETVELCSTALAWMLTTSNRFLRDRATKALVALLTDRIPLVIRMVERFADVDDPYVAERIYAVAYGVAMRSYNREKMGELAQFVYDFVFLEKIPPPHILLRDYARGVVERAIHLGADLTGDLNFIRPPYRSLWPCIPTEKEIKCMVDDWIITSYDVGDLEWARNRIQYSVFDGDFARYIIGTNSGITEWLKMRLEEVTWVSPDQRLALLVQELDTEERGAWEAFNAADDELAVLMTHINIHNLVDSKQDRDTEDDESAESVSVAREHEDAVIVSDLMKLKGDREEKLVILRSKLTSENAHKFEDIIAIKEKGPDWCTPPYFDLSLIQRYILWRVFELGWTVKRFGYFDRFEIGISRFEHKAERMGKKYQWIAFHEIMAFIADHFQYYDRSANEFAYEGPWQKYLRDIDPSCTYRETPGGTSWDGHKPAWWGSATYESWEELTDHEEWGRCKTDLPPVDSLLYLTNPTDGSKWLNLLGDFEWQQPTPPEQDPFDTNRRKIWYIFNGYLIKREAAGPFMRWAEEADFMGRWMPEPPQFYQLFLGEHSWSPAAKYFQKPYYDNSGWVLQRYSCPVSVLVTAVVYANEASGRDNSVNEGYTLLLPSRYLVDGLGLRWNGLGAEYVNEEGNLVVYDPTARESGPSALLIKYEALKKFLDQEELTICWAFFGDKIVLGTRTDKNALARLSLSGAFILNGEKPLGFVKTNFINT
jgi:hypothetical protein